MNDNEWPLKIRLDKGRRLHEVMDDIRNRMAIFSGDLNVTQFLIERMQSEDQGVRGDIILKIFGPDLPTLRTLAMRMRDGFARVPGLADLLVEQQSYVATGAHRHRLQRGPSCSASRRRRSPQSWRASPMDAPFRRSSRTGRRFDVVMRLNDADRTPEALELLRIDTPSGSVPIVILRRRSRSHQVPSISCTRTACGVSR